MSSYATTRQPDLWDVLAVLGVLVILALASPPKVGGIVSSDYTAPEDHCPQEGP